MGLSVVTIGLLVGCGSSDTPITGAGDVQTGTGYYVDSAVQGVDYECGTKSGTTDEDGKFTFEVGKECSFSVAGVPLRTTKADDLVDGVKVLEGNPDVQRFLQSIDNDNNASNGIQIDPKILEVLTQALVEHNSTGQVPTNTALDSVVTRIKDDVDTFAGVVKTPEQVEAHYQGTLGGMLKELLGGKTFYIADMEDNLIKSIVFNNDVTTVAVTTVVGSDTDGNGVHPCKLDGNKIVLLDEYMTFMSATSSYLLFNNYRADGTLRGSTKSYYKKADAEAVLSGDSSTDDTNMRSDINPMVLAGKAIYGVGSVMIESITFNADMTTATWKNEYGVGDDFQQLGNTGSLSVKVNGDNTVNMGSSNETWWIKSMDSTQVIINSVDKGTKTFYLDLEYAKSVYNNQ